MISIVTVTYNNARGLKDTLCSLVNLDLEFELIIIDGGSTDNTLKIVESYASSYDFKLVSEPDLGIYDAMNKGVKFSTFNWVYFLNAGDRVFSKNFFNSFVDLSEKDQFAMLYGDVIYEDGDRVCSSVGYKLYLHNTVHHQSAIYRRDLLLLNPFNLKYRILADYDFNLFLYISGYETYKIPYVSAICDKDGISRQALSVVLSENLQILKCRHGKLVGFLLGLIFNLKFRLRNV